MGRPTEYSISEVLKIEGDFDCHDIARHLNCARDTAYGIARKMLIKGLIFHVSNKRNKNNTGTAKVFSATYRPLNERKKAHILELEGDISSATVAEFLGVTPNFARKLLVELRDAGKIFHVSDDKVTRARLYNKKYRKHEKVIFEYHGPRRSSVKASRYYSRINNLQFIPGEVDRYFKGTRCGII